VVSLRVPERRDSEAADQSVYSFESFNSRRSSRTIGSQLASTGFLQVQTTSGSLSYVDIESEVRPMWSVVALGGIPQLVFGGVADQRVAGFWCSRNYVVFDLGSFESIVGADRVGEILSRGNKKILIAKLVCERFVRRLLPFNGIFKGSVKDPFEKGLASYRDGEYVFNVGIEGVHAEGMVPISDLCFLLFGENTEKVLLFEEQYEPVLSFLIDDERVVIYFGPPHGLGSCLLASGFRLAVEPTQDLSPAGMRIDPSLGEWIHEVRWWNEERMEVRNTLDEVSRERYEIRVKGSFSSVTSEVNPEISIGVAVFLGVAYLPNISRLREIRLDVSGENEMVVNWQVVRGRLPAFSDSFEGRVGVWTRSEIGVDNWFGRRLPRWLTDVR